RYKTTASSFAQGFSRPMWWAIRVWPAADEAAHISAAPSTQECSDRPRHIGTSRPRCEVHGRRSASRFWRPLAGGPCDLCRSGGEPQAEANRKAVKPIDDIDHQRELHLLLLGELSLQGLVGAFVRMAF